MKIPCAICGKEVYRSTWHIKRLKHGKVTCSQACKNIVTSCRVSEKASLCGHLPVVAKGLCQKCYERQVSRAKRLLKKYGITLEEYNALLVRGNGACWICRRRPKRRNLDTDHDHKTGKIRGLLCHMCNLGLPRFRDNPENLRRAADYLEGNLYA